MCFTQINNFICYFIFTALSYKHLIYGFALKTSGDALFPMTIACVFMFLFGVGGTWLFGMRLALFALGAYIGMAIDECVRAALMCIRWRSGHWQKLLLVNKKLS